jgi:DUF2924 family protein
MERAHVEAAGELSREIEALAKLTIDQLKERWRSIYQSAPPGRSSRKLLVSAIAYRMQERRWAGSSRRSETYSSVFRRTQREAGWPSIGRHKSIGRHSADP